MWSMVGFPVQLRLGEANVVIVMVENPANGISTMNEKRLMRRNGKRLMRRNGKRFIIVCHRIHDIAKSH